MVQPEGVKQLEANGWNFTANILKEQCFRYEYDSRNRMIIKQVPGAGPVYMVYDARDRLVMTQDSVMRTPHKWLTTHYDDLNRADTTWLYTTASSTTFSSLLAAAAASQKYPTATPSASTFLTETHYDNYTGISVPTGMSTTYKADWNTYLLPASTTSFPYAEEPKQNSSITTKGLTTWSRVRVLDSTLQLVTINIYDDKGRLIQTQSENITGGIDVTTTQYSWAGWPLVTIQRQQEKKGTVTQTTVVVTKMTYDDLGRLVRTEMKQSNSSINSGVMSAYATISEIGYDALGQVESKKIGKRRSSASSYTTTPLETEDYDYNIRGWLLGVNRDYVRDAGTTSTTATATTTAVTSGEMFTESSMDLQTVTFPSKNFFGFDLGYDRRDNDRINDLLYDTARFDGNITGMTWKGDNDTKIRKYDFGYDPVNRLTGAKFGQLVGSAFSTTPVNYNVSNLTYDGNGNILSLYRYGLKPSGSSTVIDQLSYTYKTGSNKLARVADQAASTAVDHLGDFQDGTNSGDDYAYDGNGNMTSDQNKKITAISYNVLNLPSVITVAGKRLIKYYYDAAGNKLQKRTTDISAGPSRTTVTTYIGGAVYQNDTLQFFGTPEGRVRANTARTFWIYEYFLKDHLGNTRMMITDDYNVSSPILEAYSYYPFGLQQKGIGLTAGSLTHNKYLYNKGSELQEDFGLDYYDTHFRQLDPQLGRWWQLDSKPDMSQSLYAAMSNNPILYNDPLGDSIPKWIKATGNFFKGAGSGVMGGLKNTGNFVMSLGTAEGWKNMGTGLMDFADRLNPNSPTGMMKNAQTVENVTSYVSNIPNMSAEALGHDIGFGLEKIGEAALLSKGASAVSNVLKGGEVVEAANATKGGSSTIYRAVSQAEAADIAKFGFRIKSGGYETGKLFAPTLKEAAQFGKYNFGLDGIPNTIMKVRVPNSVLNGATKFGADGMNAISIPANQLNLLKGTPLNYSPWLR